MARHWNIFWGAILILLGALFFLQAEGILHDILGFFWPLFLFALGAWILLQVYLPRSEDSETFSIALEGAREASIHLDHGVGALHISDGAPEGMLITGSKAIGMDIKSHREGDRLNVKIDAGPTFVPFIGPESGAWNFHLAPNVPLRLDLDAGASSMELDLSNLKAAYTRVDCGASRLTIKAPEQAGASQFDIEAGATSLDFTVPQSVAARIRIKAVPASLNIDQMRFPMRASGEYQSPEYETALNKVELNFDGGASSVNVH